MSLSIWIKQFGFFHTCTPLAAMSEESHVDAQGRRILQNYENLCFWLTEPLWNQVVDQNTDKYTLTVALSKHASLLGLCCPSEKTMALIFTLIYHNVGIWTNVQMLRSQFIIMKTQVRAELLRCGWSPLRLDYTQSLPDTVINVSQEMRYRLFGSTGLPCDPKLEIGWLRMKQADVPIRRTRAALQSNANAASAAALQFFQSCSSAHGLPPPNVLPSQGMMVNQGSSTFHGQAIQTSNDSQMTSKEVSRALQMVPLPLRSGSMSELPLEEPVAKPQDPKPTQDSLSTNPNESSELVPVDAEAAMRQVEEAIHRRNGQAGHSKPQEKTPESMPKAVQKTPTKNKKTTKTEVDKKMAVKKNQKTASESCSTREQKRHRRDAIFQTLSAKDKRKYANGCSTCRFVKRCTLSCWLKRGF